MLADKLGLTEFLVIKSIADVVFFIPTPENYLYRNLLFHSCKLSANQEWADKVHGLFSGAKALWTSLSSTHATYLLI